jgi:hypothetical protein
MYIYAVRSKKEADKAFYNTCLLFGVNVVRAYVAYTLCKLFGKGNYR